MMNVCALPARLFFGSAAALGAALFLSTGLEAADGNAKATELIAHRAVYDLKLTESRGRRPVASVRGRILYDFGGNACEGYTLQFRQVSEIDTGEGKQALSDLRATSWEDGNAKVLRFASQNYLNQQLSAAVDGKAQRTAERIDVSLSKPENKAFDLPASNVFPSEHMRRIIEAARAGKNILELPVYDGSENGERLYNTLTVIGQPLKPDDKKPDDAAAGQNKLAGMLRWPVTISYFDKAKSDGEQTPAYAIAFEVYENGISRALSLDYGDFTVAGELAQLEIRDAPPCQ
ncbi:MAG TPA: cell envelope integrity EipB family protein [Xanthobacteraceae bacterium]|jgi:hypothetical protein